MVFGKSLNRIRFQNDLGFVLSQGLTPFTVVRIDDIRKKRNIDVKGVFFTTVGYTWPAKKVGDYNNIELNTIENARYFAAQLAGNVLVKPPPFELKSNLNASNSASAPDRKGAAASAPK